MKRGLPRGQGPRVASRKSAPSTFDTNRNVRGPVSEYEAATPRYAISGPRSEPPMPMFTTARILGAGVPAPRAVAHRARERTHPVEHLVHVGDHVAPVDDQP